MDAAIEIDRPFASQKWVGMGIHKESHKEVKVFFHLELREFYD
jgi:hypothetical protein